MKTILLVEDDLHINNINKQALSTAGYKVLCATSFSKCVDMLDSNNVNLIVLDVNLPDGNGLDQCKRLKETYNIPILFLTAMGKSSDIVKALDNGGDDYMTKPYDLNVLVARVKARLRETNVRPEIILGNFKLDGAKSVAYSDGKEIPLTKREFMLIWALASNKGSLVSRERLLEEVWGTTAIEDYNAMRMTVSRIKQKLSSVGANVQIVTKRQGGYMFKRMI